MVTTGRGSAPLNSTLAGKIMSRRETPMTVWYWEQVGGMLIEEFLIVSKAPGQGRRLLDGLIVLGGGEGVGCRWEPNLIWRARM